MKKLILLLIVTSMVFVVPAAVAYEQGDYELTLSGGGSSDESFDGTVANVEAGLGYFMTPNFEVVGRQGISYADIPGGDKWNASSRISLVYNFDLETVYPYLGVNMGYLYGDMVKDQFIAGPEGGVKFFVNDTTFILAGLEYQFLFENVRDADDNFDDGRFVYHLGIGFRF